jgi:hypothetical protein
MSSLLQHPAYIEHFNSLLCHAYSWLPSNVQLTAFFRSKHYRQAQDSLANQAEQPEKEKEKDKDLTHMLLCLLSSML